MTVTIESISRGNKTISLLWDKHEGFQVRILEERPGVFPAYSTVRSYHAEKNAKRAYKRFIKTLF